MEKEFTLDGNVRSVRIDPALCPCVCKVREFTFNGKPVSVNDKKRVSVNGRLLRPAEGSGDMPGVVFPTEDPNITLHLEGFERNAEDVVSLKLEVVKLPADLAKDMAASVKNSSERSGFVSVQSAVKQILIRQQDRRYEKSWLTKRYPTTAGSGNRRRNFLKQAKARRSL